MADRDHLGTLLPRKPDDTATELSKISAESGQSINVTQFQHVVKPSSGGSTLSSGVQASGLSLPKNVQITLRLSKAAKFTYPDKIANTIHWLSATPPWGLLLPSYRAAHIVPNGEGLFKTLDVRLTLLQQRVSTRRTHPRQLWGRCGAISTSSNPFAKLQYSPQTRGKEKENQEAHQRAKSPAPRTQSQARPALQSRNVPDDGESSAPVQADIEAMQQQIRELQAQIAQNSSSQTPSVPDESISRPKNASKRLMRSIRKELGYDKSYRSCVGKGTTYRGRQAAVRRASRTESPGNPTPSTPSPQRTHSPPRSNNSPAAGPSRPRARPFNHRRISDSESDDDDDSEDEFVAASDGETLHNDDAGDEQEEEDRGKSKSKGKRKACGQGGKNTKRAQGE
ncbi:hypothetical protein C8R45DRAFT_936471 [Mycena sanguinolenta]|nr:hypothetical protein C8R45DRAFT_936471 [Mycena sanguinolenta]